MKKTVWLICMLIVETSIAKELFCLDVSDKYYQKSVSLTMGDTALSVLTPKFQTDDDLEKKEGCINRLLILKKKGKEKRIPKEVKDRVI